MADCSGNMACWPQEQQESLALFQKLLGKLEQQNFDDEFLGLLGQFCELLPESEQGDIFAAHYAYFYGDYQQALNFALKAWHKRKVNLEVWQLLIKCYDKLGLEAEKDKFQGYCHHLYKLGMDIAPHAEELQAVLDNLTMATGEAAYAPWLRNKCRLENGRFTSGPALLCGEPMPWSTNKEGYPYWTGGYNVHEYFNAKGNLLAKEKDDSYCIFLNHSDFVFDIMRAKEQHEYSFDPQGRTYILPLAGMEATQPVRIKTASHEYMAILGKWEFGYFRVEEPVKITSENDFVVGKPVLLEHSPKRKKVVINILVDALSGKVLRQYDYNCMPYTKEFFSKGIIFNDHFSVTEYTYPAVANIETGLYNHNSQLFHEHVNVPMDEEHITLSEQMQAQGYYCVNVMGSGDGVYNGATKGYDHLIVNSYMTKSSVGVDRAIQHLEAFGETDQFLFLHLMEVHPWPARKSSLPLQTQTKLSLGDRTLDAMNMQNSVYLRHTPLYAEAYLQGMTDTDRSLKHLYDYLESHYSEDEYVVQLYSDHGASVFDDVPWLVSDHQTGSTYMLRGAGVPQLGLVNELTSALDIYPAMAKLHGFPDNTKLDGNLPAALGGREREYVISNSLYPGQTYKLAIRTEKYEFQLEAATPAREDGTVDLTGASMYVMERADKTRLCYDEKVMKYFMDIARQYTRSFCTWGRDWPCMKR
ncbi:MAG: sulfatase-like hydrolase/transferase [Selenomonadaceae bacterium]|nr:sulfatase-like hydrolase/transferase [Selenomonadaceae bacterium]